MAARVSFKLFRSTSPNASAPYQGAVQIKGEWYAIDAHVVPAKDGVIAHFEGEVVGGPKALTRQMVKSAREPAPEDLLKPLADAPFDDVDAFRKAMP